MLMNYIQKSAKTRNTKVHINFPIKNAHEPLRFALAHGRFAPLTSYRPTISVWAFYPTHPGHLTPLHWAFYPTTISMGQKAYFLLFVLFHIILFL